MEKISILQKFSALHYNFGKFGDYEIDSLKSKYDIKSVMHYSSTAFSRNGQPTIVDRKTNQKLNTQVSFKLRSNISVF